MDATREHSSTGIAVERELTIAASPETVWEFLTDPEKACRWMGTSVTLDVRPGGAYRADVIPGNVASGEFVEVDPPRRLVWTWGWEPGTSMPIEPGQTTIEVELVPEGDGTLLRFRHSGLPDAASADSHATGWDHYLGRLAQAAAGTDPGPDAWLDRVKAS